MSGDAVIRGAAHYNALQADAWKQRAETAEARIKELETALATARQCEQESSPACSRCGLRESVVPGGPLTPPGTEFFTASGDKPR